MVVFKRSALAILLSTALVPGAVFAAPAAAVDNNAPAGGLRAAASSTGAANHGHFVCTAAINANGTVFSGEYVNTAPTKTMHISTGTYQVSFNAPCPDVRIALGWYRICQRDTLSYGTLPGGSCITADRVTDASAIWIQTFNAAGQLADSSFTLHVSR